MTRTLGALTLALLLAAPQTPADAPDQFYDSHFHLTNYIQQGIDVCMVKPTAS